MKTFSELVRVRNTETGAIGRIARRLFENPRINNGILVEVDETAKPLKRLSASDIYNLTVGETSPTSEDETEDNTPKASDEEEVTDA